MAGEWLRRFHPQDPAPRLGSEALRLICFPHAGGAASAFLPLARALAPAVEVVAAQYPGRQDRRGERPIDDMDRLADALTEQVRSRVTGPYALFGHSMGAVAAYEVARRLAERSLPGPEALILSGRGAPTARPARYDSLRTDEDILRVVRLLGGTTPRVLEDPELREMVMPALRADYRAIGGYEWRPGPRLDVPFTVLVADDDPVVSVDEAKAWGELTTATTTTRVFGGGHFFLDTQLPGLVEAVTAALTGAEAGRLAAAEGR
ncbi:MULTISPECIES: thioesterase II family protein [Streptomyces]|uniref:Alpha/beta fold hydrolase n=1 Tax=Streptomyces caniscabiei TaxID=2746961 RepID=A0ABU4MP25_9ACTN|nr:MULTISPECIES: alpha/beta fold hydrolase [Streptomyces]MBE4734231.1 thioesterase [Streptomyces caniscabiei]MBE4759161.1 thioesterase [Streptomyces caniscabiei]MBE4773226.1 thioesterase [Streptomyces caniscabiei]MBE4783613.1 thioesterase [Streptomyces caniscabiei]MBE4792917.1 thioesterase [Streptomyces caniscabiei]